MYLVYSTSTLHRITEIDGKVWQRSQEMLKKYSVCIYIYLHIANHCDRVLTKIIASRSSENTKN